MSKIAGIGFDIISVSRIRKMMENPKFLKKVYAQYEQEYIHCRSAQSAAGIWAAKEAVAKAIGTGFVGFTVRDVEIRHKENGQPYVLLHNGARHIAAAHSFDRIHLSISHEREHAFAFAIVEAIM